MILAVLAGGASRRMGGPKAGVSIAGRPMAGWVTSAGTEAGLIPMLVAKAGSALPELGCEVLIEPDQPRHPLAGIVAALEHAGEPLVVAPCDVPLLPAGLLAWLATRPEPLVVVEGHPLIGRFAPAALDGLREALEQRAPTGEALGALGAIEVGGRELAAFGDPARYLTNVNSPEDARNVLALVGT